MRNGRAPLLVLIFLAMPPLAFADDDAKALEAKKRGYEQFEKGNYDKAIVEYTEVIRLNSGDTAAYYYRARSYYAKESYDKAIADFNLAIRLDPKDSWAYSYRAGSYDLKGSYDNAIKDYSEAVRLDPKQPWHYIGRGDSYSKKGDAGKARSDYAAAVRLDPKNKFAQDKAVASEAKKRGDQHYDKKDYDKAIVDYSEAIRLNPNAYEVYRWRGRSYFWKDNNDKAIEDFNEYIRLNPKDSWAYDYRGESYHLKGSYDNAIKDYSEAVRVDPKQAWHYIGRGDSYSKKGDAGKALYDYAAAVRLDPKNEFAQGKMAALTKNVAQAPAQPLPQKDNAAKRIGLNDSIASYRSAIKNQQEKLTALNFAGIPAAQIALAAAQKKLANVQADPKAGIGAVIGAQLLVSGAEALLGEATNSRNSLQNDLRTNRERLRQLEDELNALKD